jgi:hypothetical protein
MAGLAKLDLVAKLANGTAEFLHLILFAVKQMQY